MQVATPTRTIVYAVEPFDTFFDEAQEIIEEHWEEIALDKGKIKLAVDRERYQELDGKGILHTVTVRDSNIQKSAWDPGKLVGYHLGMIVPHLHYKNDLHGLTDVFFIRPDYRKGRIGIELFKYVEKTMKERGVVKLMTSVKLHKDVSLIFEYLGWKETERTFCKYIGD